MINSSISAADSPLRPWLTPKWIARLLLGRSNRLSGCYSSFADASTESTYPDGAPVTEDLAAARDVLQGKAAYCRDGVRFFTPPASVGLSALAVLAAAAGETGSTRILDFGGGAASLYLAHRPLWSVLPALSWNIVEREQLVAEAKSLFSELPIHWHTSLEDACAEQAPDLVIMSSVLQYLPNPSLTLQQVCELKPRWLVIDRTPLGRQGTDIIAMQRSPRALHGSCYPSWIFGRNGALGIPDQAYGCVMHQASDDPVLLHRMRPVEYHGWLFRRAEETCD